MSKAETQLKYIKAKIDRYFEKHVLLHQLSQVIDFLIATVLFMLRMTPVVLFWLCVFYLYSGGSIDSFKMASSQDYLNLVETGLKLSFIIAFLIKGVNFCEQYSVGTKKRDKSPVVKTEIHLR